MIRTLASVSLLTMTVLAGGCTPLGPVPTEPEVHMRVQINSIPSGADVYAVDPKDGTLGQRLGRTPFDINVGLAWRRFSDGSPYFGADALYGWGRGVYWGECRLQDEGPYGNVVNAFPLNMYVAAKKDGYRTQAVNKQIALIGYRRPWPPADVALTIPLAAHESSAPHGGQQQQQQQQQQTVVISGNQGSATPQTGAVSVSASIQGAEVYVDGVFVGNTPANLKLSEGIHIIEVKKTGFASYRRELRVFAGSNLSLVAEMVPQ